MRELDGRLQTINSPVYRARPTATFAEFAKRWDADVVSTTQAINSQQLSHSRCLSISVPFFGQYQLKDMVV